MTLEIGNVFQLSAVNVGSEPGTKAFTVELPLSTLEYEADRRLYFAYYMQALFEGVNALDPRPTSFTITRTTSTLNQQSGAIVREVYTVTVSRVAIPGNLITDPI